MEVRELSGALLDLWVAKAEGFQPRVAEYTDGNAYCLLPGSQIGENHWLADRKYSPSTDWSIGGPIIERQGLAVRMMVQPRVALTGDLCWEACYLHGEHRAYGSSPLQAAARSYVKSKFGDVVPDEVPA